MRLRSETALDSFRTSIRKFVISQAGRARCSPHPSRNFPIHYNRPRMDAARIVDLLGPFLDSREDYDRARSLAPSISTYIDMLLRWNARMNLTAIREPEQIITRHFGESFFAARHLFPATSSEAALIGPSTAMAVKFKNLADLGSGAGFPGIPIAILRPDLDVTLIESHQRKGVFLREVSSGIDNIRVFSGRAETLRRPLDWVVARAVLPANVLSLNLAPNCALLVSRSAVSPESQVIAIPWGRDRVIHVPRGAAL